MGTDPTDVAKPSFWCDVAQALHFLSAGGIDTTASVVSVVNVLLDLVRATGTEIEERRRKALYSIADYCTISKDLTRYLEEVGITPAMSSSTPCCGALVPWWSWRGSCEFCRLEQRLSRTHRLQYFL